MLNLTRAIDRATGYIYVPPLPKASTSSASNTDNNASASARPNEYQLFSTAAGPMKYDIRDVQERWVDARKEWDEWEEGEWRREGEAVRMRKGAGSGSGEEKRGIRMRGVGEGDNVTSTGT